MSQELLDNFCKIANSPEFQRLMREQGVDKAEELIMQAFLRQTEKDQDKKDSGTE